MRRYKQGRPPLHVTLPKKKMAKQKHFSDITGSLIEGCAEILDTSIDALVEEFEQGLKPEVSNYSREFVEFCSSKALSNMCPDNDERITDGTLSRLTFDMMLSWENPCSMDEKASVERLAKEKDEGKTPQDGGVQTGDDTTQTYSESMAKKSEDGKVSQRGGVLEQDDIPLFYSDLMPLLVGNEQTVGEEAVVWLASLLPLFVDVVNARFAFEALTAHTANRLHFPAYDFFLKEMHTCTKYLQKQATPNGVELEGDEFILHVDGTTVTQRVVRHIGATSWPGRLTLTNYALYFEASSSITYDYALKIDLSREDVVHKVSAGSTGPWGAPIFDKAVIYESSLLSDPLVLEFPEMTSSTRRDHWLALTKEIIFLHQFLSKFNIESPLQAWEMHAKTILGIIRLHAAREMLRLSPPIPNNFLIFSLFNELPKGDYVLEELSGSLKKMISIHPCSASSILKSLNMSHPIVSNIDIKEGLAEHFDGKAEDLTSLETTIGQVREEAKQLIFAEASAETIKEGVSDAVALLMELLRPLKNAAPRFQQILAWERPRETAIVLAMLMAVIYKEWIGYAIAALLLLGVRAMLWARQKRIRDRHTEIVVDTSLDQTTMESIVSAQHRLKKFGETVQAANIAILKLWSILISKAPKHTNLVMLAMVGVALLLVMVPVKYIIMAATLYCFTMNTKVRKSKANEQGNRRMREWWNSIPVVPIRKTT